MRALAAGKDAGRADHRRASRRRATKSAVEFRDDGAGLNLPRIREQGHRDGPDRAPTRTPSDAELANLIFTPGFSTADAVTELAGRGIGMDVVRSEVNALGGRIETASARRPGHELPSGAAADHRGDAGGDAALPVPSRWPCPSTLIEIVRRANAGRGRRRPMPAARYPFGDRRCRSSGSARCCRPAARSQRAARARSRGGHQKCAATHRAARR